MLNRNVIIGLIIAFSIRIVIYFALNLMGYFYGIPWDTFSRTSLAWQWSRSPYFVAGDGYWLPLQFWLVGSVYALIRPITDSSDIAVPVIVNNLFLFISISVIIMVTTNMSKPVAAVPAGVIAGFFAPDIFVSYSALSEPIYISLIILIGYALLRWQQSHDQEAKN